MLCRYSVIVFLPSNVSRTNWAPSFQGFKNCAKASEIITVMVTYNFLTHDGKRFNFNDERQ